MIQIVNKVSENELASEDIGAMSGLYTQQVAEQQGTNGRPYYIWYRDSEPTPQDTQSLSIEYELLYQAQKEAEYRSKLKIYVTTFILFFSFVLILLIFSPFIYKVFFTPHDTPVESSREESQTHEASQNQNLAIENLPPTNTQNEQSGQSTASQQNMTQAGNKNTQTSQNVQQQTSQNYTQEQDPLSNPKELTKNPLGWNDEKYKVIYILLDNSKYTIQESAWDSEAKANNRLKTVESLNISGLTGSIIKADLAGKGVWFRNRFGEFSTIEEAREMAIELRNKEGMRIAMLLYFLFFG